MAASSGDDVPAQLATLLGRETMEIRRTEDTPPRVSVIDVASIITGHGADYASQAVRNVYDNHPEVREKITDFKFPGRRQRKTPVTDVQGIIEIIMLLRGCHAARVRRQAAELLCRYLGGDLALVDEVIALRGFQEELAAEEPENPRRVFGEVVEAAGDAELLSTSLHADRKRLLEEVRSVVRQELQQHHVWSFSKRSRNHRELMDMGRVVHGTALRELDQSEGIIRIADFLKDRIEPAAWMLHGRKFKNIYAVELKRMKIRESLEEGLPPPVAFNQGEHRIVYTNADTELMIQTLSACRVRFEAIAGRDAQLISRPRGSQRSIVEFMHPRVATDSESDAGSEMPR